MSQFLMLSGEKSEQINNLIQSVMVKKIPTIQVFPDGSLCILNENLKLKEKILLILYHYQESITNKRLNEILKPKSSSYIPRYLKLLQSEKLVHKTSNGNIITLKGIKKIEDNRKKFFTLE
ncbi:MAG: hypothetical protein ACTSVV_00390 [Promethearchaeota archaeon]